MRKVCLAGLSEVNRWWANQQPPDVEVWGMNEGHNFLQRYDRWYQIHPKDWSEERKRKAGIIALPTQNTFGRGDTHVAFLKGLKVPLYMRPEEVSDVYPTSRPYPYGLARRTFHKPDGSLYLTSSASFMLAHALLEEDIREIRIAGIEMSTRTEYEQQRANFEFLLGYARAKGVVVVPPPTGCSLFSGELYAGEPHA